VEDRYRGGGGGGRQGGRYGRRRRGRGGGRPRDVFPDIQEPEEHFSPWAEDFEREPNPDAEALHLAYDSVYTHEGDVREELLENWVEASANGKRWRCWNCGKNTQRFTQLRLPTLRTVVSICDNCGTWTVWDAWRDLANPRIFSFRRTIEETEPAQPTELQPAEAAVAPAIRSNGSGRLEQVPAAPAAEPPSALARAEQPSPEAVLETATAEAAGQHQPVAPTAPEPALQPSAPVAEAKPKRAPRTKAASPEGEPKARTTRSRAKKTEQAPAPAEEAASMAAPPTVD
jgi:hypothetical protein